MFLRGNRGWSKDFLGFCFSVKKTLDNFHLIIGWRAKCGFSELVWSWVETDKTFFSVFWHFLIVFCDFCRWNKQPPQINGNWRLKKIKNRKERKTKKKEKDKKILRRKPIFSKLRCPRILFDSFHHLLFVLVNRRRILYYSISIATCTRTYKIFGNVYALKMSRCRGQRVRNSATLS